MTDIQGALGAAQMKRAPEILEERRFLANRYDMAFGGLDWLSIPKVEDGYEHGYQSYACLFEPEVINENSVSRINVMRNAWMDKLQKDGVSTRPATHAVHMLSYYKEKYGIKPVGFPNAYAADQCSISLPLFHGMKEDEQNFVIDKVLEFEL
jgi:dTDP-4-amino-4,6-dideoxygalactose transaminase